MSGPPDGKVHFKGLNGIRALAALLIATSHANLAMGLFGLETRDFGGVGMAGLRVWAFFVMSGFLVTYLLLVEKSRFGAIDLQKFHVRRVLRIAPVYFLALLTGIVLLLVGIAPAPAPVPLTLGLFGLLLPNVAYALGLKWWVVAPLWSVGAIEQFLAFWPSVLQRSSQVVRSLAIVIVAYLAVKVGLRFYGNGVLYQLVRMTAFDSMAIGGLAAILVLRGSPILRWVYHPAVQVACWAFVGWGIVRGPVHVASVIDPEIHSAVIAVIVLNVSCNPRTLVRLDGRVLDRLGRISYGVYAYNMPVVFILGRAMKGHLSWAGGGIAAHTVVQAACLIATLAVAQASYVWIEGPFLTLRDRFGRVPAGS